MNDAEKFILDEFGIEKPIVDRFLFSIHTYNLISEYTYSGFVDLLNKFRDTKPSE